MTVRLPVLYSLIGQWQKLPSEEPTMFSEGLVLMVIGMSVVFLFLGLLVLAINATSFVFRKIIGNGSEEESPHGATLEPAKEDNANIAAIVASVVDYSRDMLNVN